jgi:hypothetical protein
MDAKALSYFRFRERGPAGMARSLNAASLVLFYDTLTLIILPFTCQQRARDQRPHDADTSSSAKDDYDDYDMRLSKAANAFNEHAQEEEGGYLAHMSSYFWREKT